MYYVLNDQGERAGMAFKIIKEEEIEGEMETAE